jgi:uncharacterized membrane protein
MSKISKVFFQGFVTLLPIALTIYIMYSAIIILESLLGGILRSLLPQYVPGLGLILILILIYLFGLMLNSFLATRIISLIENKIQEIPFIKAIYSPLRDMMNLFSREDTDKSKSVVLVNINNSGSKMIGLVTREQFDDLKLPIKSSDYVAVYFPFSYALGGNTHLVPKSEVTPVDLPMDKAMSLAITAWVKADKKGPLNEK